MTAPRGRGPLPRIFEMLADHLEDYIDGDSMALERLAAAIDQSEFGGEELQAAVLALRGLGGERAPTMTLEQMPGHDAQRILNSQERDSLSPEAWGALLGLRRRGALDPGQLERVMDRLAASGIRPIDVGLAHEVAAEVVLAAEPGSLEPMPGESDVAH